MLTRLQPENFAIIRALFPKNYPNLAFVNGAISKNISGEIWVDDINDPKAALVICGFYIFLAGEISKEKFDNAHIIIKEKLKLLEKMSANVKTNLSLICPPEMLDASVDLKEYGFSPLLRTEYGFKDNASPSEYNNESRYELVAINNENISHCLWHRFLLDILGTENFSRHLGFMLWDKEAECVASEAYGIVGDDLMEIASVTNPDYIKQGLSTNVCTRLIVEATKKGLHPIWSCSKQNIPSNKTALKLGMEVRQDYSFQNITPVRR